MGRNRWRAQCQILICAAVLDAAIFGLMAGTVQVRAGAADSRKELSLAEEQAILPDTGRILLAGSPEMTAEEGKENSRFAAPGSVVALTFDDGPHKNLYKTAFGWIKGARYPRYLFFLWEKIWRAMRRWSGRCGRMAISLEITVFAM